MNRTLSAFLLSYVVLLFQFLPTPFAIAASASPETLAGGEQIPPQSTFRLRAEEERGLAIITGHGTAFGIDLAEFGFPGQRYLLTACHVIRNHSGELISSLKVETKSNDANSWVNVQVLAYDPQMDLALLKCDADLPRCSTFVDKDTEMGGAVKLIGCPAGIIPTEYEGHLIDFGGVSLSAAHVTFFKQGCSGGPVFDRSTNKVLGVAVAGVGSHGSTAEMDPHTCLFVSHEKVKGFVTGCMSASKTDSHVVDTTFEPTAAAIPAESIEVVIPQSMPESLRKLLEGKYKLVEQESLAEYVDVTIEVSAKPNATLLESEEKK